MDKRVIKTRAAVFSAVMDLTVEKDPRKITVLELCKRAGINKSTFYLHYSSIDDCIQKCFNLLMSGIVDFAKNFRYEEMAADPVPFVDTLLDEIEKCLNYLRKIKESDMAGQSIKVFKESIVKSICEVNNFNIRDNYHQVVKIIFIVGGCIDAFIEPLPAYNREEMKKILIAAIKRNR